MFTDLFKFALINLSRARGRLLITASGVLIGTAAVILLLALTFGLQASAEEGLGDNVSLTEITVYPNYQTVLFESEDVPQITLETVEQIRQLEGVDAVIPILPLLQPATLRNGRYNNELTVYGVDFSLLPALGYELIGGNWEEVGENQMIVGEVVADNFRDPRARETWIPVSVDLFASASSLIIENLRADAQERLTLSPAAVVRTNNDFLNRVIFLPFEDVLRLNNFISGQDLRPEDIYFEELAVRSTGREATLRVVAEIEALGFATDSLGAYLEDINNFFLLMRLVLGGVGVTALLIASFGVANTMMMAIIERTAEIGLLKALGARDRDVLTIFLIEAGMVGFVGGVAGVLLAVFLQGQINGFIATAASDSQLSVLLDATELTGDLLLIPQELLGFAIVLATLVGLGAGFFPAMRAAKLSPVIALKTE